MSMKSQDIIRPDFLLIGAQKSGTTWLWGILDQHPGTDLPQKKEIHFFGGVEIYRKGREWYYNHFENLDSSKVSGEASTTYLYDNIPYWYNPTHDLQHDHSLPAIPELITNELPNVKILVVLRDPVWRAVSAYKHYVRNGFISPLFGLEKAAKQRPRLRILEYGHYAQYIRLWEEVVPPERMRIFIFEHDIVIRAEETARNAYGFLGLDAGFKPDNLRRPANKSWGWSRLLLDYYTGQSVRKVCRNRVVNRVFNWLDRLDPFKHFVVKEKDIEFLRSVYLPAKGELEALIGRNLDCWDYGCRKA
jgi:hypothetical protein